MSILFKHLIKNKVLLIEMLRFCQTTIIKIIGTLLISIFFLTSFSSVAFAQQSSGNAFTAFDLARVGCGKSDEESEANFVSRVAAGFAVGGVIGATAGAGGSVAASAGSSISDFFFECLPMGGLYVSTKLLKYSAIFFDNFLFFSITSSYLRLDVIETMWTSIKDLANIAFILILIFFSYRLIFNGSADSAVRSGIIKLIIIALLINFSLFFTRVIIDVGNITALTFYNAISAPDLKQEDNFISNITGDTQKFITGGDADKVNSISGAVVSVFNPSRMFTTDVFKEFVTNSKAGSGFQLFLMILSFSVISVLTAKELFWAGFLFLSRTIWLIFLMIISPLAFVSYFVSPAAGKANPFMKWLTLVIERSFCLVPYIFAIWVLIFLTDATGASKEYSAGTTSFSPDNIFMIVLVQFAIVFAVLKIARSYSTKICEGGMGASELITGGIKKAAGFGLGVATGGASVAMRSTAGRVASDTFRGRNGLGEKLAAAEENGSTGARLARRGMERLSLKTFGTDKSFEKKRDEGADKRFKESNTLENINKRTREKKYTKELMDGGMSEAQAKKAAGKRAGDETRKATNNVLAARASQEYDRGDGQGPRKGGVMSRMVDWAAAGGTNAADEALKRRIKSESQDDVRKKAQAEKIANKEERQVLADKQVREVNREGQKAANNAVDDITQSVQTGSPVVPEVPQEVQDSIQDAFAPMVRNADGEVESERSTESKNQADALILELKKDLEDVMRQAVEEQKPILESLNENIKKATDIQDQISGIAEVTTSESEDVRELSDIMQEINSGKDITMTDTRRELLMKNNMLNNDGSVPDDIKEKVIDVQSKKRRNIAGLNNELQNFNTELSGINSEINSEKRAIKDLEKSQKAKISKVYQQAGQAAKSKANATVRAEEAFDMANAERIERDSRSAQKTGADISNEDQDARETDFYRK